MRMPPESRLLIAAAAALVPASRRADWLREWEAEIWWWLRSEPRWGWRARLELLRRVSGAFRDALWLCMEAADVFPAVRNFLLRPAAAIITLLLLIAMIATASHGFRNIRRAADSARYARVAVLAQSGRYASVRFGVPPATVALWNARAQSIEGAAVYVSHRGVVAIGSENPREVTVAEAGANFFPLLGIDAPLGPDTAVISREFAGGRNPVGQTIVAGGRRVRVTAVLPAGFRYLDAHPALWTLYEPREWRAFPEILTGAIARLKPGVSPAQAELEMRLLTAPKTPWASPVYVTVEPLDRILRLPLTIFAGLWLALVAASCIGAVFASHGRIFLLGKSALSLTVVSLVVFEFGGAAVVAATGTAALGAIGLALWLLVAGSALALWWCWTDHRNRCRTCLSRLTMPVRMGSGARTLFEPAGVEVMCPHGHGTLLTSEGAQHESHWAPLGTLCLFAAFLVLPAATGCSNVRAQADARPDFSGRWQLASAAGATPPDALALDIEQNRAAVEMKASWQEPRDGAYGLTTLGVVTPAMRFTANGAEDLNQVGPFVVHSRTRWESARMITKFNTSDFQGHSFYGTWTRWLDAGGREMVLQIAMSNSGAVYHRATLIFRRR